MAMGTKYYKMPMVSCHRLSLI